jgi:hypothetical protein
MDGWKTTNIIPYLSMINKNTLRDHFSHRYVQTELYNLIVSLHEMNTNWQFLAVDISILQCIFAAERRKNDGCWLKELKTDYILLSSYIHLKTVRQIPCRIYSDVCQIYIFSLDNLQSKKVQGA